MLCQRLLLRRLLRCNSICLLFFVCVGVLPALPALAASKGYRLVNIPPQWRFQTATSAYNPENGEKLGDFQKGIRVDVLDIDAEANKWRVRYSHYGSADVEALIDWPNFPETYPHRWEQINNELSQAPLLATVLANEAPWSDNLAQVALNYFQDKAKLEAGTPRAPERILARDTEIGTAWGMRPLSIAATFGPDGRPILQIEFWNKSDGFRVERSFPANSPHRAYTLLNEKLQGLSRSLEGNAFSRPDDSDNTLSLIRELRSFYPLVNNTQALLRYQRNEYLILELRPFEPPQPGGRTSGANRNRGGSGSQADSAALAERLRKNINPHKDGYRYIDNIPMISQGDKGYCAAATIARVLQYYGYQVDMHQMASLADTESYGTTYRNMISAMRRVCNSTPFRFRTVRSRDKAELRRISIERGLPLIWLVPGHARLLIGIDPDENGGIVYSDSWGPGHDFKTMSWSEFIHSTVDLFLLDLP